MRHNTLKKFLSVALALSMSVGVLSTAGFAAEGTFQGSPQDYAYVYLIVSPRSVQTGDVVAPPRFEDFENQLKESGVSTEVPGDSAVTEAEGGVTSAITGVTEAQGNIGEKPVFDADGALAEAVDTAEGNVNSALTDLENAKPTFTENSENDTPAAVETPATTDEQPAETPKTFSQTVSEKVAALDAAKDQTEGKVEGALDAATSTQTELINLAKAASDAKANLVEAQDAATKAANDANEAAAAAQKACDDEKDRLQKELDDELAKLDENKPSETAPALASYASYEDYSTAYQAWEAARVEYNAKRAEFTAIYDQKVEELNATVQAEQAKVTAAQNALTEAKNALESFEKAFDAGNSLEVSGNMAAYSELITKYNEALKAYTDAIPGYNAAIGSYETAAGAYDTAVGNYDTEVGIHNELAGQYNAALHEYNNAVTTYETNVDTYKDAVTTYETEVENYNTTVIDAYNTTKVEDHNRTQIADAAAAIENGGNTKDDALKAALAEMQNNIEITITNADGTETRKTVGNTVSAWSGLTDEEYNKAVAVYNGRVSAYNDAVTEYNNQAEQDVLDMADRYFKGQGTHTAESKNTYYTIGRVYIGNIFGNNIYANSEYNSVEHYTDSGKLQYRDQPQNNELFTWVKGEDGQYTTTLPSSTGKNGHSVGDYYGNGQGTDAAAIEALKKQLGSEKNLIEWGPTGEENDNPIPNVNKWQVVVARGADGYRKGAGNHPDDEKDRYGLCFSDQTLTMHINATMRVDQLSQLAELKPRAEAISHDENKYSKDQYTKYNVDETDANNDLAQGEDPIGDTLENVNAPAPYDRYPSVIDPMASTEEKPADWVAPEATPFVPGVLENNFREISPSNMEDAPDEIVPPVTPEPPTGGGGGGGTPPTTPPTTISDPAVPLTELPEEETPLEELPEEETPLEELPEQDVPLADVPRTGDISMMWYAALLVSVAGLLFVAMADRKLRGINK